MTPGADKSATGPAAIVWRLTEAALQAVMAFFLLAMAVITVIDVGGRYFLGVPLTGGYEIVQYLMALTVFAALPLTARSEGHLTVSLVTDRFRGRVHLVHRICILTVSAAVLALLAWRMGAQAAALGRSDATSGTLGVPLAPVAWTMAGLAWLSVGVVLVLILRAILGHDRDVMPSGTTLE